MKSILLISFFAVTFSWNAFAETPTDEIVQAQQILDMHANNCGNGNTGWWLKLNFSTYSKYQQGGISVSTGEYWGCGTCGDCRSKLNADIDAILNNEKQRCTQVGGETKSQDRGVWTERIQPSTWTMNVARVGINCEKWVPCSN